MRTNALTRYFFIVAAAVVGIVPAMLAGPERMDYSKDRAMVQQAPVCDLRWYISIGGGIDLDYQATDFVSRTEFQPYAGDPSYVIDLGGRKYDDAFGDTLYRIQGEFGYVLNNHIELFGLFKYAGGYADSYVAVDYEGVSSSGVSAYPIGVYFDDYRSWGGELGLRWFFFSKDTWQPWRVRPYVSISGGATFVESINVDAEYLYNYSYLPAFKGTLYDDSMVGTGALMLGLEVPIACHWAFGVEGGIRYESELDGTDVIRRTFSYYDPISSSNAGTYDLGRNPEHYNSDGSRLYFPANLYLKFRF